MITAGVDCGAKTVKVVVLQDGEVVGKAMALAGTDTARSAARAYEEALARAGLGRGDVRKVVSTGAGKTGVTFRDDAVTEAMAGARGIHRLRPEVRTVIDVGAEDGRAIKVSPEGNGVDFVINERCAAGAGAFAEAMARVLEVELEELGALSLESTRVIPLNAQCVVFAESEAVTLVHRKVSKPDIARAVHDAIASRIASLVRRVGVEERIALVGGVARNVGLVRSLEKELETDLVLVDEPEYVGAIGAALVASEE